MRKWLTLLWLLFAVAAVVYHYDRGPTHARRLQAWEHLQETRALEQAEEKDLEEIILRYDELTTMLPEDEDPIVVYQIRLAQSKARLDSLDIAGAIDELDALLNEVADEFGENAPITSATREASGKAHYMAAWILQSVDAPEKEWLPYAERARQIFRYLAEHKDPAAYRDYERRVERTVQTMTERM
jgi:hypothetical protein